MSSCCLHGRLGMTGTLVVLLNQARERICFIRACHSTVGRAPRVHYPHPCKGTCTSLVVFRFGMQFRIIFDGLRTILQSCDFDDSCFFDLYMTFDLCSLACLLIVFPSPSRLKPEQSAFYPCCVLMWLCSMSRYMAKWGGVRQG